LEQAYVRGNRQEVAKIADVLKLTVHKVLQSGQGTSSQKPGLGQVTPAGMQ
jgi:hypothetical protein